MDASRFYDELIDLDILDSWLPEVTSRKTHEMEKLAYSILDKRIMAVILRELPKQFWNDFVDRCTTDPSDLALVDFLIEHAGISIQEHIRAEYRQVLKELVPMLMRFQ